MDNAGAIAIRGPWPRVDGSRNYWEKLSEEERQKSIHADMAEAEQLDMAYELTKGWGRYAKAVEAMFAGTESDFVQGGAQLRGMLDDGELIFLEPSGINLVRRLASLTQPVNDRPGAEYTVVGTSAIGHQPMVSRDVYKAARAFFDANAADCPYLIRSCSHGGRESASVLGRTTVVTKGGENEYGKWIGVADSRMKQAYDGIVAAGELVANIQERRAESFERAKIRSKISGLAVRDLDEVNGMYLGKIVSETDLHVVQSIGCGLACIHSKEKLSRMMMVGQKLSITYSGGCVRVAERSASSGIER